VGGVYGITRQYAPAAFQAAYTQDILLLPSTTGALLAVDAWTGATLWTLPTGAAGGLRARMLYDPASNRLFVPTNGGGVLAYDMATSSSSVAPSAVAGWTNPGGTYALPCVRTPVATDIACIDTSGTLRDIDKTTGAVRASLPTGVSSPSSLSSVSAAPQCFVVGNSSKLQRVTATFGPTWSLALGPSYTPASVTLSPPQVFVTDGLVYLGGSDKRLHKLSLSTLTESAFVAITPQAANVLVGPPAFDMVSDHFYFSTDDGHLWAVPWF